MADFRSLDPTAGPADSDAEGAGCSPTYADSLIGSDELEELFRAHYLALLRLGVVLTNDRSRAEDLVQESFVRFHRSSARPRPGAELAYLRRIVVNLAHDHRRRASFLRRVTQEDRAAAPSPESEAATNQRQRDIATAVRRLPRRQRECVVLHYFAGLAIAEIAGTLMIRPGSVKTHLHRARETLARELAAHQYT